jgi:hypothetical protein
MKLTQEEMSKYRQEIERSDLAPDIKQQALLGMTSIEKNDGDLEAAVNDLLAEELTDTQLVQLLRWDDLVNAFPDIANNKQLEEECIAKFLAYCQEENRDFREKSSWSAYLSQKTVRTAEKLPSNPEVWVVKTVQ